jgi:WD repeat-containing protein 19
VDEISPEGGCMVRSLDWDHEGECLAILLEGTGIVPLWDAGSRSIQRLDTNMSDPSFMVWSQTGLLAVGMTKGNLLLYNRRTRKKIPVLGKHPKRITCGAWSRGNQLALGSDDRTFTLSNGSGDTLEQTTIKHPPTEMHFWTRRQRSDGGGKESEEDENCVSIIMDGRSLLLMNVKEPDNPTELAFKDSYGDIVCHRWFGDGQIAIAFSEGYLVAISTNPKELGEELFCGRFYSTGLVGMDYCEAQGCVAMAGEGGVKIVNMQRFEEMKGDSVSMEQDEARISKLGWSPDGQILTVASRSGVVYNFLANLPALHASYGSKLAYLSSLRELTVLEGAVAASSSKGSPPRPLLIPLSMEPSFLALGASHAAVGMNNRVSFYRALPNDKSCVAEEDYMGRVEDVKLNKMHAAVLSAGQVILHSIEPNSRVGNSRTTIPDPGNTETNSTVICMGLTDSLLIYGTSGGCVELFHLQEWAALSGVGLRHQHSIRRLCPNYLGTRILVMDTRGGAFVFSTALGDAVQVPSFPSSPGAIFWDQSDRHVFSAADGGGNLHVYAYVASSVRGATVTKLGPAEVDASGSVTIRAQASPMPVAHTPILSYGGLVTCQIDSGSLATFVAAPFDALESHTPARATPAAYRSCFLQNLALLRLKHAWRAAVKLDDRAHYLALGNRAMEVMDVHMAIHVYRELGDAGMVMGLEEISHVEDKNLLAGHIALLFGDYSVAQELFLSSSTPEMALQMRRDLMQWDHALKLAQTLNPKAVPGISAELGQQLEFKGEWEAALHAYEAALAGYTQGDLSSESKRMEYDPYDSAQELLPPEKHALCTHGLARCTLRLGDLRHGISMAKETRSPQLLGECAAILEDMKQYSESASLWELSGQPERAAAIHIQTKDFSALASIIGKVTMPKLLCQYAKVIFWGCLG